MARQKKPVHRVQMTEGKRNIIHQLLEEYDIQSAEDIQDALKDLLGGTIKEMMEAEMDDHLGYEKSERSDNDDYRNGYKRKQVNSRYGSMEIEVPQDRKSTFEPQVVKKRQKDISDIDQKIISMYAKGMTTRQISETIEDPKACSLRDSWNQHGRKERGSDHQRWRQRKRKILAFRYERTEKPGCQRCINHLCRWFNRHQRSNRCCFSKNRVSALYRTPGKKHTEICP